MIYLREGVNVHSTYYLTLNAYLCLKFRQLQRLTLESGDMTSVESRLTNRNSGCSWKSIFQRIFRHESGFKRQFSFQHVSVSTSNPSHTGLIPLETSLSRYLSTYQLLACSKFPSHVRYTLNFELNLWLHSGDSSAHLYSLWIYFLFNILNDNSSIFTNLSSGPRLWMKLN